MQISRIFSALLTALSSSLIVTIAAVYYSINTLPSIDELMDMDYQVPLKVYTSDHKLIGVFGEKFRQPVYLNKIPKLLQNAYIAVEDQRFYDHFGVDPVGLTRAIVNFVLTGKKSQGASTITMQVARNFFLSKEKTWVRKINEILLALKIEYNLPKSKILELYLNKIYLGNRSYGVAAASEIYYAKDLDELTIAEIAMLAGLPKAPSSINPVKNPKRAMERRNFVLKRMYDEGFINLFQYSYAVSEPIRAKYHGIELEADAPHVSNLVHQLLRKQYGDDI
jgi:penicillin-binding protein 1A